MLWLQNFLALCGTDQYNNCIFHRVVKGFIVQTGDPTNTGKGGTSIWGEPFPDELHEDLTFFVTCAKHQSLDGKHTIFGKLIDGFEALEELENVKATTKIDDPKCPEGHVNAGNPPDASVRMNNRTSSGCGRFKCYEDKCGAPFKFWKERNAHEWTKHGFNRKKRQEAVTEKCGKKTLTADGPTGEETSV
ncbi:Peptidyl-prolyl cis-trans isomerase [Aphelenchoides fujianensis]|nr:Peptidyl-prolyl cis-trans isomerase [Aphelenchoides fujianensis]